MGRDRAGNLFRAAGYEMMKRVMPRVNAALSNNTHAPEKRRAILKALWGMFCFDRSAWQCLYHFFYFHHIFAS